MSTKERITSLYLNTEDNVLLDVLLKHNYKLLPRTENVINEREKKFYKNIIQEFQLDYSIDDILDFLRESIHLKALGNKKIVLKIFECIKKLPNHEFSELLQIADGIIIKQTSIPVYCMLTGNQRGRMIFLELNDSIKDIQDMKLSSKLIKYGKNIFGPFIFTLVSTYFLYKILSHFHTYN